MNDPYRLAMLLLPKVPMMSGVALNHALGRSETSKYWGLKTELVVNLIRAVLNGDSAMPLDKVQRVSMREQPVKGKMWISRVTMPPPPEDSMREALFLAIDSMADPEASTKTFIKPELREVTAEWTGYRAGATKQSAELDISEEEKYKELMKEVSSPTTILYFHGGAYYLMDLSAHRPAIAKLTKMTKGRALSVRYRLAPQNPFPGALLDAFVSYFTLLYPPPGALHEPVAPEHIVFSGDSAGGNLCFALTQLILQLRRQNTKVTWHGEEREVPLPAGVATSSPWLDVTHCMPSSVENAKFDYLPSNSLRPEGMTLPPCDIWPAKPPRKNIFVEDAFLAHPMVSLMIAKDWENCPPVYMNQGQELLSDEGKYLASVLVKQGVKVVFEEYEAMPHCFALLLQNIESRERCFAAMADFMKGVVTGGNEGVSTKGTMIRAKTSKEEALDVATLSPFSREDVLQRMGERIKVMIPESEADTLGQVGVSKL